MKANFSCGHINMDFTHTFLPTVYMSVFIVGLVANCWGLKSLFENWKKFGNINIFVLNLGVTDILYLLTLPFLIAYYSTDSHWAFGQVFCKITRFCFNLNLYGSIGFLTCISVYRYLGIVHPLRMMGRITKGHSVAITAVVWILVCIESIPDMFFDKTLHNSTIDQCFDTTSNFSIKDYLDYSIAWTVSGFFIPLLIILGCYGHVAVVLYNKPNIDQLMKRRCLKLVLIVTLLFSVCYIPYHMFRNLNLKTRILKSEGTCQDWFAGIYIAHQVSRALVCLNSAINPLVYIHSNEDLLVQITRLWERACRSVPQLFNHRIQAQTTPL